MSERMDPEDVTEVMNECFAILEAAVHRYGGTVDKYIGDCIMAVFGVPAALEDAPRSAINAAIDMRNGIASFNRGRVGTSLAVHTGINTGLVLAGAVGGPVKHDFTVMGDAVNLASRLKDASSHGEIWVGPETYRQTRKAFDFTALPPLTLKNKAEPVAAWAVRSMTPQVHRTQAAATQLVGRHAELAMLGQQVARLLQGEGGVVTIEGEAGIGKSRILHELTRLDVVAAVRLLEGRSVSLGKSLSYHPFVDLLSRWLDIASNAGDATLARLESRIAVLAPDLKQELIPFVATLMGLQLAGSYAERVAGIEGEAMERLLVRSMRELLGRLAADRPLVLVFEDVHWADESSIDLLLAMLRLVTECPILFVLVFRPDHPTTAGRLLDTARTAYPDQHTHLALTPLDAVQSAMLARRFLDSEELPTAVSFLIERVGEGNPFYIEEVMRSLRDAGAIEDRNGRPRLTRSIDTVDVPGTIQEIIMARVDRLEAPTRRLLQAAAIIGPSFPYRLLVAVTRADQTLEEQLEHLVERQFLEMRDVKERAYVFRHALIHQAVYDSIRQRTRKDLHRAAAVALESLFADRLQDVLAMLAYHYGRADDLEKAGEYLTRAGEEAARSAASAEALHYFQEASRVYLAIHGAGGDPIEKARLEKNIGLALFARGRLAESVGHFTRSLEHLGERSPTGNWRLRGRFGLDVARIVFDLYVGRRRRLPMTAERRETLEVRHNRARAQVTSETRRFVFDTIGTIRRMNETDPRVLPNACGMYAEGALLFSFFGFSTAVSERVLGIAERLASDGNPRDAFAYQSMRFLLRFLAGDWSPELLIDPVLVDQMLKVGNVWEANTYLGLACERDIRQGEFKSAARGLTLCENLASNFGYAFAESNVLAYSAMLDQEHRRLEQALMLWDRYLARPEPQLNLFGLGYKARVQLLQGDLAGAVETVRSGTALARGLGQIAPFHASPLIVSRLLVDLDAVEQSRDRRKSRGSDALRRSARASARSALRMAAQIARERPEVYRAVGRLAWLRGRRRAAMAWFTRSVAEAERLGARPELARTYIAIAHRLNDASSLPPPLRGLDPAAVMERARIVFSEIGLTAELERLDDTAEMAKI